MKLREFIPNYGMILGEREKLSGLIDFVDFVSKSGSASSRAPTVGIDTLVNSWIRQQFQYREQLLEDLITISRTVSELAAPIMHLRNEVFRKGITWEPKFAKKCEKCGKEFDNLVEECEGCGSKELRDPDEEQLETFTSFMDDCNCFDQSLEDVLKQFHVDINTVDDGYLYLAKEYIQDSKDNVPIIRSKITEIRRLRPSGVEFDLNEKGLPKCSHYLCVLHRDNTISTEPGECPDCHMPLIPAMYRFKFRGGNYYFTDSEICHASKFFPSETYGYAPVLILFEKALIMVGMDKTLFRYFFERRMPLSLLMVATDDTESIRRARSDIVAQLRQNPDYVPIIGYSSRQNARGRVDFVRLFNTLMEMDFLNIRNEIRERIASIWGLPPMWQSEHTGMGGLSNQSQQLVQFSRVVESDQRMFNEKVFPFISEAFGITDWKVILSQPEEKAESTRIQFAQQRISAASMLKQMGFDVELKEGVASMDDIEFKVSGKAEQQPQMGGMGEEGLPFGMSHDTGTWTSQLQKEGYIMESIDSISPINNRITAISFMSKSDPYIATFDNFGKLIEVIKAQPLHVHGEYPPHDKNIKHKSGMATKPPQEEVFKDSEDEE